MYILTNNYGNAKYKVETEQERDELLLRGLHETTEEKKTVEVKKNVRKNKNTTETD